MKKRNWIPAVAGMTMLSACAMSRPIVPDIYKVGEIEIRFYQNQSDLERDIMSANLVVPAQIGSRRLEIRSYYDPKAKRIYCLEDARLLLHEIRHYLEPEWRHPYGEIWPEKK